MLQTNITKQYRVTIRNNFTLFIKMKTNTLVIFTNVYMPKYTEINRKHLKYGLSTFYMREEYGAGLERREQCNAVSYISHALGI